jgi:hypothetical protein
MVALFLTWHRDAIGAGTQITLGTLNRFRWELAKMKLPPIMLTGFDPAYGDLA